MTHADDLRAWAMGVYTREAGTELLLRAFEGRLAAPDKPWVVTEVTGQGQKRAFIYFDAIPLEMSEEDAPWEHAVLLVAASLGGDQRVWLGDVLAGMPRHLVKLVLAAVSHAAGQHDHYSGFSFTGDGSPGVRHTDTTLYPWPEDTGAAGSMGRQLPPANDDDE